MVITAQAWCCSGEGQDPQHSPAVRGEVRWVQWCIPPDRDDAARTVAVSQAQPAASVCQHRERTKGELRQLRAHFASYSASKEMAVALCGS